MLLWPVAVLAEPSADTIAVNVDQARLVKLPARVATIVVGNPLIADVALHVADLDHRVVVDQPKPDPNAACRQ